MRMLRWLLRLCPDALRRDYGGAMEDMLRWRLDDASRAGSWRHAGVWTREAAGLLALAASERWGAAARERQRALRLQARHKAGHMDRIGQEIAQGVRRLARTPAFALAALTTLALAIGANAAIFTVVERVILNPLPYPESDRVLSLRHRSSLRTTPSIDGMPVGVYFHYAERARTLASIAVHRPAQVTLTGAGTPLRVRSSYATPSLASVLRVPPAYGRWFTEEEGRTGAAPAAVLSHGLWTRSYGSDPQIVGRTIAVNGVSTAVVGVMPAGFTFFDPRTDLWIAEPLDKASGFGVFTHGAVARLRDGATIDDARRELNALIGQLPAAYPDSPLAKTLPTTIGFSSAALTVQDAIVGPVAARLWIILTAVGLVLLVACANVANLFLVRSETRQRELAVRRALGAGRAGIVRYFLIESLLLSVAGGALGLALAWGAVRVVVSTAPATLPRLHEVQIDGLVVAFTLGLSVLAAIVFGSIPLFHSLPLARTLHQQARGDASSPGRHHARRLMMAGQVAFALVLLVSSGLLVRSFQKLRAVDPGFNAESVLTFGIGLPDRDYSTRQAAVAAHRAILDRIAGIPGVVAASTTTCLPLAGNCFGNTLNVEGRVVSEGTIPPIVSFRAVAGGYAEAMGMRLLRGRTIDRGDVDRSETAIVINKALADAYFPDQDPIGRRISSGRAPNLLTIVGVVSNTPLAALEEPGAPPKLYMPMSIAGGPEFQSAALVGPNVSVMSYVVRTSVTPESLVSAIRAAIDGVDPKLAMADVTTLEATLDRASGQMAFTMALLAIAAGIAMVLGAIGIYGVMSYVVSQRTGEIGVRLALGAAPESVARMIGRQGGYVALAGIVIGLVAALAGGRLMASLLYGVSPRDPVVFIATTLVLLVVTWVACWLPARRAARLSPLEALRTE